MILPEAVKATIPPLHTQDTLPDEQLRAYVRLTCEELGFIWFLLELHEDGDTFSGYWIEQDKEQFGYFSFEDIDDRLPASLAYDASFTPQLLVTAVQAERRTHRVLGEPVFVFPETASLAEHRAYYYVALYDQPYQQVFTTIRTIIHEERTDLSVYTLLLGGDFYVVVIGDRPPEQVHTRIVEAFHEGTITIIPYDLLLQLYARKLAANQKGEQREGHRNTVLKRKQKQKFPKTNEDEGENNGLIIETKRLTGEKGLRKTTKIPTDSIFTPKQAIFLLLSGIQQNKQTNKQTITQQFWIYH